eukprot:scaffold80720_cov71-Phaeocystis_antarctica.AAC.19
MRRARTPAEAALHSRAAGPMRPPPWVRRLAAVWLRSAAAEAHPPARPPRATRHASAVAHAALAPRAGASRQGQQRRTAQ